MCVCRRHFLLKKYPQSRVILHMSTLFPDENNAIERFQRMPWYVPRRTYNIMEHMRLMKCFLKVKLFCCIEQWQKTMELT